MDTLRSAPELLSAEFLTQLERFALISRRSFRGRVKGERRSPRKGSSVEFSDYRQYGAGDDIRYVDWNIYGRLDRLYLKLFVDEEDLCLHLLVDASASMDFGAPSNTIAELKERVAKTIAFVKSAKREQIDGTEDKDIVLKFGTREMPFKGEQFLVGFTLPNFFFHYTTAYNILRSLGLDVGKQDFMGAPG